MEKEIFTSTPFYLIRTSIQQPVIKFHEQICTAEGEVTVQITGAGSWPGGVLALILNSSADIPAAVTVRLTSEGAWTRTSKDAVVKFKRPDLRPILTQ